MLCKELLGHSGCKVLLYDHEKRFVRKISKAEEYNQRLKAQAEKQDSLRSKHVKTPIIYGDGQLDGLYYFDMEYINGVPFNNYISRNTIQSVDPIVNKLVSFVLENEQDNVDCTDDIAKKLLDLEESVAIDIRDYKEYCLDFDWSSIPCGFCHGDLTFENVIVHKSEPYLIDFLDSFLDTKFIDFSKILQDILLLWSWRHSSTAPIVKNIYIYNRLQSFLSKREMAIVNRLLVINMIRILPYANEEISNATVKKMKYILEKFRA